MNKAIYLECSELPEPVKDLIFIMGGLFYWPEVKNVYNGSIINLSFLKYFNQEFEFLFEDNYYMQKFLDEQKIVCNNSKNKNWTLKEVHIEFMDFLKNNKIENENYILCEFKW